MDLERLIATLAPIEVLHRANSRQTYAAGAIRAARWLVGRVPGLYTMEETL